MLTAHLHPECVDLVLSFCDPLTREVLRYIPTLIPLTLLEKYEHTHGRSSSVCSDSARTGSLPLLEWAKDMKYKWCLRSLYANAAYGGHLHVINYLLSLPQVYEESNVLPLLLYISAAHGGHVHILESYIPRQRKWRMCGESVVEGVLCAFVEKDNLEALQKYNDVIVSCHRGNIRDSICKIAALHGHLRILQYMVDINCFSSIELLVDVIANIMTGSNPSLLTSSLIRSLTERYRDTPAWKRGGSGCFLPSASCARGDDTMPLEWVLSNGFKYDGGEVCIYNAAEFGNLKVLKMLLELSSVTVDDRIVTVMSQGATKGYSLNVLKYIRSTYPSYIFSGVCDRAAIRGDLNTIQWAIENGCTYNKSVFYSTASNKSDSLEHEMSKLNILMWLESRHNCECHTSLPLMCISAVQGGNLKILEYYTRDGISGKLDMRKLCEEAIGSGQLSVLLQYWNDEWHGIELSISNARARLRNALNDGDVDVTEFLYTRKRFVSVEQRVTVLEWLKSK